MQRRPSWPLRNNVAGAPLLSSCARRRISAVLHEDPEQKATAGILRCAQDDRPRLVRGCGGHGLNGGIPPKERQTSHQQRSLRKNNPNQQDKRGRHKQDVTMD